MDITQLRYFLATADTLNYTKAAERLYMSRQALRQALASMEEELGFPLFLNERNKLSLTVQGEYLLLSATKVVEAFENMLVDMGQFTQGQATLQVGLSVSLFPFLLPELGECLDKFQQKYPQIQLDTMLMSNDEVIEAVETGEIDCGAVVQMTCRRPGIKVQTLAKYPAVMSVGHYRNELQDVEITLERLAEYSCIGMGSLEKTMVPLYEDCRQRGIVLKHEVVPDTIDAFYRISHGEALGFDVGMGRAPKIGKIFDRPLQGYTWEVGFLYPDSSKEKREVQLFERFVEEEYRRIRMRKEG